MRLSHFATVITLLAACGDTSSAALDASIDGAALVDAPPEIPCSTQVTSTVSVAGQTYGFAAMGNVDVGGESACGGPPEAVVIVLSVDPAADVAAHTQRLELSLPLETRPITTTLSPGTGAPGTTVTLDVTSTEPAATGPGLARVAGTLSGVATGSFTASVCPRLTTSCI